MLGFFTAALLSLVESGIKEVDGLEQFKVTARKG